MVSGLNKLLFTASEGLMEPTVARKSNQPAGEFQCGFCGTWRRADERCCVARVYGGLDPYQYVDPFWEEA